MNAISPPTGLLIYAGVTASVALAVTGLRFLPPSLSGPADFGPTTVAVFGRMEWLILAGMVIWGWLRLPGLPFWIALGIVATLLVLEATWLWPKLAATHRRAGAVLWLGAQPLPVAYLALEGAKVAALLIAPTANAISRLQTFWTGATSIL